MIKHYRFAVGATLSFLVAALAGVLSLNSVAEAAPSTPTYTIEPRRQIEAVGGFLDDSSSLDAVFRKSGGSWELVGEGSTQPRDASSYVNLSKPSVIFKWTGNNLYVTHVNYTNVQPMFSGVVDPRDPTANACYVAVKTNAANTSAAFVGANRDGNETADCTRIVQDQIAFSSFTFTTGSLDGETILGVEIPTCTQTPGSSAYATCMTQRNNALNELASKVNAECLPSSGGTDGKSCGYYRTIERCLNQSERNSVTDCKGLADARAILNGDYSSITGNMSDSEIQAICNRLNTAANRAKCIADATAERDRLRATGDVEDSTSCNVQGIGWIICPIITLISNLNDAAFGILSSSFLETESALVTDPATRNAWTAFRDIANVLFVIAFVAIVYGQMIGGRS